MPPASPRGTSKPSMMFERRQSTGLVPPQQPPLIMNASGSSADSAAPRTRSRRRCPRGVKPAQAGIRSHAEEVHGEVVQIDPHLLQLGEVLHHGDAVLAPVAGDLV